MDSSFHVNRHLVGLIQIVSSTENRCFIGLYSNLIVSNTFEILLFIHQ